MAAISNTIHFKSQRNAPSENKQKLLTSILHWKQLCKAKKKTKKKTNTTVTSLFISLSINILINVVGSHTLAETCNDLSVRPILTNTNSYIHLARHTSKNATLPIVGYLINESARVSTLLATEDNCSLSSLFWISLGFHKPFLLFLVLGTVNIILIRSCCFPSSWCLFICIYITYGSLILTHIIINGVRQRDCPLQCFVCV